MDLGRGSRTLGSSVWSTTCRQTHFFFPLGEELYQAVKGSLRNGFGGLFQFLMKIQLVSDTQRRPLLNLLPLLPPPPQKKSISKEQHYFPIFFRPLTLRGSPEGK